MGGDDATFESARDAMMAGSQEPAELEGSCGGKV